MISAQSVSQIMGYMMREYRSCWDFVCVFYVDQGYIMTDDAQGSSAMFSMVAVPADGDLCIIGGNSEHCGVYHQGGILHHVSGRGLLFNPLQAFHDDVKFYRPNRIH